MGNKIRVETLATKVTEQLRNDVLNKRFQVGEHITIKEVSELYGVSPMPVREAFRVLEGESLLKVNAYKGAVVQKLDKNFISDVYGVLRAIECAIYQTAVFKITDSAIDNLNSINVLIKTIANERKNGQLYETLNTEFHDIVINFGTNKLAEDRYYYYHDLLKAVRRSHSQYSFDRIKDAAAEHDEIIAALASRNKNALREAVESHSIAAMNNFILQYRE